MLIEIPETFILGAASSAWQTEGWQGKKGVRILSWINGINKSVLSGMKAMDRPLQRTSWNSMVKTLS